MTFSSSSSSSASIQGRQALVSSWFGLAWIRRFPEPRSHAHRSRRLVEDLPCRTDEGVPGQVLLVPGLLTDQDEVRVRRALAEDGLRGVAPEIAAAAVARGTLEGAEAPVIGHPGRRSSSACAPA